MIYSKVEITSYISLSLPLSTSQLELIESSMCSAENAFYINLLNYFIPEAESNLKERLIKITALGYLYYYSLLKVDSLIDGNNKSNTSDILDTVQFIEITIKGLSDLYNSTNQFWTNFDKCKKQYYVGFQLEKEMVKDDFVCSQSYFEDLAECKSAFCYAYIYAIQSLLDKSDIKTYFEILKKLHISIQYCDDIEDYVSDVNNGQVTYIYKETIALLKQNTEIAYNSLSSDQLLKFAHLSGITIRHYQRSLELLSEVLELAQSLNLYALCEYINQLKSTSETAVFEIKSLNEKAKVKVKQSYVLKRFDVSDENVKLYGKIAINDAIKYLGLKTNNDKDNGWQDFLTSVGLSKNWVTSFVLTNIFEIKEAISIVHRVSPQYNESSKGLSGFHETFIPDADSSNFYSLHKKQQGKVISPSQINNWLEFMDNKGGWSTYIDKQGLIHHLRCPTDTNLLAWMSPQNCVSAASAHVLSKFDELANEYHLTCSFLKSNIREDGSIKSYWWTSSVYATAYSLLAFSHSSIYDKESQILQHYLISRISNEGCVVDEKTGEKSAFYTALAIKAITSIAWEFCDYKIKRAVAWLLQNQTLDGSWMCTPILQMPDPSIENTEEINHWRVSPFGFNCLIEDHYRVFSTSLIANALNSYFSNYQQKQYAA